MKKQITFIVLILLAFIVFYINFSFDKTKSTLCSIQKDKIFFEFFEGGNCYKTNHNSSIVEVNNLKEVLLINQMICNLKRDFYAPHRVADYSVYINVNSYKNSKYSIKLSYINNEYVFHIKNRLYRNDTLASFIFELLKIKQCP